MNATRVVVVGAGISGLTAAYRLRGLLGPSPEIVVVERNDRIGGVLHTGELAGQRFDVGAEAYLAYRPEVPALLGELGLTDQIVHPTQAPSTIRAGGRTVPMPVRTFMGIPGAGAELAEVLSPAGVEAVEAESAKPLPWEPGSDVALGPLVRERFGDEVADRLVEPLLGGVFAGRIDFLGLRGAIPYIAAALDGGVSSLTAAANRLLPPIPAPDAPPRKAAPFFGALRDGYGVLLDGLLDASKAQLRLGTEVSGLGRGPKGWLVELGDGTPEGSEVLEADAVVLAVPAPVVAALLAQAAPEAAEVAGEIELATSVVISFAFRDVPAPTTAGVLVAAGEPLSIKAATHSSTKWAHHSTDGLVRLRVSIGRHGDTETPQLDDAALIAKARADLATLQGITAEPVDVVVQRWEGALPQYGVGHDARIETLEKAVAQLPGLAVAGAALHGVGVPACIATANQAAEQIAAGLRADG